MTQYGEMAERLKAPVLKTGDVRASVGSNPTLSASFPTHVSKADMLLFSLYGEVPKRPKGLPC